MDLNLPPRAKEWAKRARAFCDTILVPLELVVDEHGELPEGERPALREAVRQWGLAGINHASEDGGCGFSMHSGKQFINAASICGEAGASRARFCQW